MSVDLADLLTPKTADADCAVAVALAKVDKPYREQLEAAIGTLADARQGRAAAIPQGNVVEAFRRLGHKVSIGKLRDHIRGRCSCG